MNTLNKINNTGMPKILFYDSEKIIENKNLDLLNYIFAKNGMYIIQKSDWGRIIKKTNTHYVNTNLLAFENDLSIIQNVPSPSIKLFETILEVFKRFRVFNNEVMINIYYDKINSKHVLDIPEKQFVTSGNVKYEYSNLEHDPNYIRYLQIHSHHTMSASFSGTDNKDEQNSLLCYYGVLGKIQDYSNFTTVDKRFRVWDGIGFSEIPVEYVFDIPDYKIKLSNEIENKIDKIIEFTNKEKKKIELSNKLLDYSESSNDFLESFFSMGK